MTQLDASPLDAEPTLAEFEDRFNEIDSKLDDSRSTFGTDADVHLVEEDEDDEDEVVTTTEEANTFSLKASLAEQAATEMEAVVNNLKNESAEPRQEPLLQNQASDRIPTNAEKATSTSAPTLSSSNSRWIVFAILLPTILSVFLGWKLSITSNEQRTGLLVNSPNEDVPTYEYQKKFKRTQCRYINGRQYCESDEQTELSSSGGASQHNPQRRASYYQRQRCSYVNGESYCESYEQEASSVGSNGGSVAS